MSLFNSQTIFSILISLLIGIGLYYYVKYKYRVLELTQREQAKVLQSVIMAMNNNSENMMNMARGKSQEEIISDAITNDTKRFRQVNSNNELIDVSDDSDGGSESESDGGSDSDSGSESGSESESEREHEHVEEEQVSDNTTRKILFTGNNESHVVEHLDGPDVKVIELTHPLYPKNSGEQYNGEDGEDGEDDDEDEDEDVEDEEDSDSESIASDIDGPHEPSQEDENHEVREIKGNVAINDVNSQIMDLETDNISEVILTGNDNSLDNISVKAVFKTKDSETHSDYNSMNVQSLRQLLRNKLSSEGSHMSEASINKLTKKDLIKYLS